MVTWGVRNDGQFSPKHVSCGNENRDHAIVRALQVAVAGPEGRLLIVSGHAGGRQHDSRVLSTSGLPER